MTASDDSNWIFSFGGDDKISAGSGDDWVVGGRGNDTLLGDAGDDILSGGLGHDVVYGGVGEDVLYGGWGNDTIVGGEGSDSLWGGLGNDAFVFDSLTTSSDADRIQDFRLGDIIALDQDVFSGLGLGRLKAENFVSGEGAVAKDANDLLIFDTATHTLSYDADGSGSGAAIVIATMENDYDLSTTDFLVI